MFPRSFEKFGAFWKFVVVGGVCVIQKWDESLMLSMAESFMLTGSCSGPCSNVTSVDDFLIFFPQFLEVGDVLRGRELESWEG